MNTAAAQQRAYALAREAMQRLREGELPKAEALAREALSLVPADARVLSLYGSVLHSMERHVEAVDVFARAVQLAPSEAHCWVNLGTAQRGAGDLDAALRSYARAAHLGCASADFFFNVGLAHLDRRDYEAARSVLKRALDLAPNDALIRFEYVKACYESLHTEEALAALEGWTDYSQLDSAQLADLGQRVLNLGDVRRAERAVTQLTSEQDVEPRALLTLAQVFERTNRLDQAQDVLARLARDPRAEQLGADLFVTQAQVLQRHGAHEEAIALFQRALDQTSAAHDRHFILFPLAKSLDALRRYDDAYAALRAAHESQCAHLRLTAPVIMARGVPSMEITKFPCDPDDVARWTDGSPPSLEQSPIFVVAFPRSGTTLLEQTLDAHPHLVSMDEQPLVQNAIDDILALGIKYPEQLAQMSPEQLASVRGRYFERAARKVRLEAQQRLVDKNPLNLLRLPAIRRLFPNARVVLAIRHPCDVIVSCFMQHFRAPEFALLCADVRTLATGYRRSFDFWYEQQALLRAEVLEVRYETFVTKFEPSVRALAQFLGLPWDSAMLAPGEHAKAKPFISTPSYSQVVQPVSAKAVGRWRAYENQLAPIIPLLRPYLERWQYEGPRTEGT